MADLLHRQRIDANAQQVVAVQRVAHGFFEVVPAQAADQDAGLAIATQGQRVGSVVLREFLQGRLLVHQLGVGLARIDRQQREATRVFDIIGRILRSWCAHCHGGATVCQTRDQAQQHRHLQALRQFESLPREVVALLLVTGLHAGHHGKVGKVARVLLVLRAVHGGVVGHGNHQSTMRAGDRHIHERIGRHIEAHVLHRDHGAATGVGHADPLFECHLLVGRPHAAHRQAVLLGVILYGLVDLGRRRAGIGIGRADPRIDRTARDGFVAEQNFFRHACPKKKQGAQEIEPPRAKYRIPGAGLSIRLDAAVRSERPAATGKSRP